MNDIKTDELEELLHSSQRKQLKIYTEELCYFNRKFSLFSRRKEESFIQELIWDSLLAGQALLKDCNCKTISDIGSGAGFPGLVLAVLDSSREFWLFEPNRKKASFLEYAVQKMNLKNTQVKNIPVQQEKTLLSCAVSKAFLSLSKRLIATQPCLKKEAVYYHLQSLNWKRQWEKSPAEIRKIWRIREVTKYSHPLLPGERVLLESHLRTKV